MSSFTARIFIFRGKKRTTEQPTVMGIKHLKEMHIFLLGVCWRHILCKYVRKQVEWESKLLSGMCRFILAILSARQRERVPSCVGLCLKWLPPPHSTEYIQKQLVTEDGYVFLRTQLTHAALQNKDRLKENITFTQCKVSEKRWKDKHRKGEKKTAAIEPTLYSKSCMFVVQTRKKKKTRRCQAFTGQPVSLCS